MSDLTAREIVTALRNGPWSSTEILRMIDHDRALEPDPTRRGEGYCSPQCGCGDDVCHMDVEQMRAALRLPRATPPDPAREPEVVDEPGDGARLPACVSAGHDKTCACGQYVNQNPAAGHVTLATPATPTPTEGDGEAVEALARVLCAAVYGSETQYDFGSDDEDRGHWLDVATHVLAAGYRKVGDDEVVVKRADLELLLIVDQGYVMERDLTPAEARLRAALTGPAR